MSDLVGNPEDRFSHNWLIYQNESLNNTEESVYNLRRNFLYESAFYVMLLYVYFYLSHILLSFIHPPASQCTSDVCFSTFNFAMVHALSYLKFCKKCSTSG